MEEGLGRFLIIYYYLLSYLPFSSPSELLLSMEVSPAAGREVSEVDVLGEGVVGVGEIATIDSKT